MNGWKWDQERNKKVSGNKWKWPHNSPKLMGHSKGSPEREVHSTTGLPKEDRKTSDKQCSPHLQELEEQKQSPEKEDGRE